MPLPKPRDTLLDPTPLMPLLSRQCSIHTLQQDLLHGVELTLGIPLAALICSSATRRCSVSRRSWSCFNRAMTASCSARTSARIRSVPRGDGAEGDGGAVFVSARSDGVSTFTADSTGRSSAFAPRSAGRAWMCSETGTTDTDSPSARGSTDMVAPSGRNAPPCFAACACMNSRGASRTARRDTPLTRGRAARYALGGTPTKASKGRSKKCLGLHPASLRAPKTRCSTSRGEITGRSSVPRSHAARTTASAVGGPRSTVSWGCTTVSSRYFSGRRRKRSSSSTDPALTTAAATSLSVRTSACDGSNNGSPS